MTTTVLIVDDSKLARIVAARTLSALEPDWSKIEAANADEAEAIIASQPIDVALLDYNMPGMNGLDLAASLRRRFADMPIAIVTANIQDGAIERARELNVNFVSKPLVTDDLRSFISGAKLRLRRTRAPAMITLDAMERDALTELVNISVSRAATSLSRMVNRHILFSVPSVEIITPDVAAQQLGQENAAELVAVRQEFEGMFSGRALLIFPHANSLELVRAITNDSFSEFELGELENEALSETGNVILNSCLGSIANMLERPLTMSLPQVVRGDGQSLFNDSDTTLILFLYIDFSVQDRSIRGYLALIMDMPSLDALRQLIGAFIQKAIG